MKISDKKYQLIYADPAWVYKDGSIYMGMGRHTRANAEICLLGTKGKGLKRMNASIYNTQLHPRGKHSQKPDAFRKDIEKLYGDVSRLEMFARVKPDGWDVWGNEAPQIEEK